MCVPAVFSYIDPMSGAILIQAIIAVLVACGAFFRRSIWRFVCFLFRVKQSDEDHEN